MLTTLVLLGVLLWITSDSPSALSSNDSNPMEAFCRVECISYQPAAALQMPVLEGSSAAHEIHLHNATKGGSTHA